LSKHGCGVEYLTPWSREKVCGPKKYRCPIVESHVCPQGLSRFRGRNGLLRVLHGTLVHQRKDMMVVVRACQCAGVPIRDASAADNGRDVSRFVKLGLDCGL
jgi:hypothetical protein